MSWIIKTGDACDWLAKMAPSSVDALVCDPPAGISFMGKEWDHDHGHRDEWIKAFASIFAFALRAMKPGAHGLVWALPRTSHWTATALEDAGFEVRDIVMHLFGSGFPKSLNVSKAIDQARNDDVRPVCRFLRASMEARQITASQIADVFQFHPRMVEHWAARDTDSQPTCPTLEQWKILRGILTFGDEMDAEIRRLNARKGEAGDAWKNAKVVGEHRGMPGGFGEHRFTVTDPTIRQPTPEAIRFDGWGTALKPAAEHWILVRKPFEGTVAANVVEYGTGGLNIDGCRIGLCAGEDAAKLTVRSGGSGGFRPDGFVGGTIDGGVPPGWNNAAGRWPANVTLDEEAAAMLDARSGIGRGLKADPIGTEWTAGVRTSGYADKGGASRFFYVAKASRSERDAGCDDLPPRSGGEATDRVDGSDGLKSPRAGAGRGGGARNHHPTVKAAALMAYLIKLITPPEGIVLDPFMGSGSTGVAAVRGGFNFVGIEREEEYVEIARRRIEHAEKEK